MKEKIVEIMNRELDKFQDIPDTYAALKNVARELQDVYSDHPRPQTQIEKIRKEPQINRVSDLRTKITPALIIHVNTLRDVSLWQLIGGHKDLEYYEDIFKEVVNFSWGNSHQYFSNNGTLFSFHLSYTGITVWDSAGMRTIFKATWEDGYTDGDKLYGRNNADFKMPANVHKEMVEACYDYMAGKIRCSKCEAKTLRHEIAGTFYAGQYCSTCWEGGVKQQAAKENYD